MNCLNKSISRSLAVLVIAGSLSGQGRIVVPAGTADTEQASRIWIPGLGYDGRMQVVIDSASLSSVAGRNLTGIEFRRDTSRPFDQEAGSASVIVRVGVTATAPFGAVADFTANAPSTTVVFAGTISASNSTVTGYAGWVDPHVVRIQFTQQFAYSGGHLVIDLEGSGATHVWWPVDAATDSTAGAQVTLGSACGPLAQEHGGRTLAIGSRSLVVGSTVVITSFADPTSAAMLLFGLFTYPVPIDLSSIGAPGCLLQVQPIVALSPTMSGALASSDTVREFYLGIPADAGLLSATFAVQGIEIGFAGLSTSEGLSCQIAGSLPVLGCALVRADALGVPQVITHQVPVVGILHD